MVDFFFYNGIFSQERTFDFVVGIPIYKEQEYIFETLASLEKQNKNLLANTIVVLYVNNSLAEMYEKGEGFWENQQVLLSLKSYIGGLNLLVINRSSESFALAEMNVGLARYELFKIAFKEVRISSRALCLFLDGDTLCGQDYLAIISQQLQSGFCVGHCKVIHQKSSIIAQQEAIDFYENYLYNYVEGLKFAGSAYAYYTVGSSIVCRREVIEKCGRVMRKKAAGEDFYFLQEARKSFGEVVELAAEVYPSARISDRVPFGTGKAVEKIMLEQDFKVYGRVVFVELKKVLDLFKKTKLAISKEDFFSINLERAYKFFEQKNFFVYLENWQKQGNLTVKRQEKILQDFFDALKQQQFLNFCL